MAYIMTALDSRLNTHETLCRSRLTSIRVSAAERISINTYNQMMNVLPYRGWESRTLALAQDGIKYANLGFMSDADIMAMCFLILMQAAKSAQEDLKSIMNDVNDTNDKKEKLRALADKVREKSTTSPYLPWPPLISLV